jgi:hypothetical protein
MYTHYLDSARLLAHVIFLSKDIALSHFSHQNGLLPSAFLILNLKFFVYISLSLDKEEYISKRLSLLNKDFFLTKLD